MISLICYHNNAQKLYPKKWIDEFRQSILSQTYQGYEILELEYGGGEFRIFDKSIYESKKMGTFVHAMNYLLNKSVLMGYYCSGNLNIDDVYAPNWLSIQLPFIKYHGYDLVSCNFTLIENDVPVHYHFFDNMDIKEQLEKNHNIVCHPGVLYSKKFLENNKYVPEEVPQEDLLLWKRTIDKYKFKIVPENLLYHRLHNNAVCKSTNR